MATSSLFLLISSLGVHGDIIFGTPADNISPALTNLVDFDGGLWKQAIIQATKNKKDHKGRERAKQERAKRAAKCPKQDIGKKCKCHKAPETEQKKCRLAKRKALKEPRVPDGVIVDPSEESTVSITDAPATTPAPPALAPAPAPAPVVKEKKPKIDHSKKFAEFVEFVAPITTVAKKILGAGSDIHEKLNPDAKVDGWQAAQDAVNVLENAAPLVQNTIDLATVDTSNGIASTASDIGQGVSDFFKNTSSTVDAVANFFKGLGR